MFWLRIALCFWMFWGFFALFSYSFFYIIFIVVEEFEWNSILFVSNFIYSFIFYFGDVYKKGGMFVCFSSFLSLE